MNIDMPPGLRALRARLQPQNPKPGLRMVRASGSRTADVYLYDEIGFWGITAQDFVPALNDLNATQITLHVNSPGGDVFDGVAIYNALRNHPATVDVRVEGLAASAASFIAMAGDTVTVEPGAQLMIHDASGLCLGDASDMTAMAALLDRISDTIAGIYAAKAGGTIEDWRSAMRAESWFSGAEAVAAGLADDIAGQESPEDPEPAEAVADTLKGWPTDAWDLSGFTYPGRDAAPAPKLPTAQAEPTPDPEPEPVPAKDEPEQVTDAIPEPVETAPADDAEAEPSVTDEDTWGALVAQLTTTAPLDVIGDALASLREAMQ